MRDPPREVGIAAVVDGERTEGAPDIVKAPSAQTDPGQVLMEALEHVADGAAARLVPLISTRGDDQVPVDAWRALEWIRERDGAHEIRKLRGYRGQPPLPGWPERFEVRLPQARPRLRAASR
jgi:hypothetical protein